MDDEFSDDLPEEAEIAKPSHPFLRRRELWLRELMIYSPRYPATAREVGAYLAIRMSEKRPYTWPSQARIAADLGRKRETINIAISRLRADGLISGTTKVLGDDAEKDPRQLTYQIRLQDEPETDYMLAKRDK